MDGVNVRIVITAEGPLAFSERKPGGTFQHSTPYVPGSALRGALAAQLLNTVYSSHRGYHFQEECGFCQVFLVPEAAVFTNAYPVLHVEDEVQVLPATAVSCKHTSGFLPSGHGVFDTLIDRLCWEILAPAGLVYNPICPDCRNRVESFTGFYVRHEHKNHDTHYHKRSVDQKLQTHVAINRRRMVAEEGLLFSPYVVSEVVEQDRHSGEEERLYQTTTFVGHVWGLPDNFDIGSLEGIEALGGRSSQGLGQVRITAHLLGKSPVDSQAVQARVEALNQAIGEAWECYRRLGGKTDDRHELYFTLTLRSDGILETAEGFPGMIFDEMMLEEAAGIKAKLIRSHASYGYGGGWQSAWGLPKPSQVVTRAGSVYVFEATNLTAADYKALAELETRGIGRLTPEGYGQVRVADEFHLKRRGIS